MVRVMGDRLNGGGSKSGIPWSSSSSTPGGSSSRWSPAIGGLEMLAL